MASVISAIGFSAIALIGATQSAEAASFSNVLFDIQPTIGPHGWTATATIKFDIIRNLPPADSGELKFNVLLWEDDGPLDEFIGIFAGPSSVPAIADGGLQIHHIVMNPYNFVPHTTGGMHSFFEGDTIEVYAEIKDAAPLVGIVSYKTSPINVTDVPTPALLPGLIGMGVAALRKRKQEDEI
jgi:hypothetical protein